MQLPKRNTLWAIFAATVVTLLAACLALAVVILITGQASENTSLDVLRTQAHDHGQDLKGIDEILNLKGSSVKAITNGQDEIIGYLVTNNEYVKAICASVSTCRLP